MSGVVPGTVDISSLKPELFRPRLEQQIFSFVGRCLIREPPQLAFRAADIIQRKANQGETASLPTILFGIASLSFLVGL
jgi:hypothetical protein